jgi:haloalkane dehalogenase
VFFTGIGSFVWRDVMLRLSNDFRCIALDPPGIGLSPAIVRHDATLRRSADAVRAAIDAFDLHDLVVVAHDTGGPPAFAVAGDVSERICGLVGLNTFGWRPSGPRLRGMLRLMGSSTMREISVRTGLLSRLTGTTFGVGRHLDAATRRAYRAGLQRGMTAFHDYLHDTLTSDIFDDVTRALTGPLREMPVLTIFGERNDPFGFQPQWKALFPSARQFVIPKGNHFPMCDAPETVADHIRSWYRRDVVARKERTAV